MRARSLVFALASPERLGALREQVALFEREIDVCVGLEALESGSPARAVLLDGALLEGGGSSVLLARVREWSQGAPLLMLSQRGDLEARMSGVRAGVDGFVRLPVDAATLIERVDLFGPPTGAEPIRVFALDGDVSVTRAYQEALAEVDIQARAFTRPVEMFEALEEEMPELFLLDLHMPECSGREIARAIRQDSAFVGVPIVFVSGQQDVAMHMWALQLGSDQLIRETVELEYLTQVILARVNRFRRLRSLMAFDGLTRLYNHTHFKSQLSAQLAQAERQGAPLSLAMLDIDHFKQINDHWGHPFGDRVLRGLAQLLKRRMRRSDVIGRYGGDEFAVLMPDTDMEGARVVLEQLRELTAEMRYELGEADVRVTVSCGIATTPPYVTEAALTGRADQALYEAKRAGRDQIVGATPLKLTGE